MKFSSKLILCTLTLLWGGYGSHATTAPASPMGYWKTEANKSKVHVYPCSGDNNKVCGRIVELKEPIDPATGQDKKDPEGRLMKGMEIMKNFSLVGEGKWEGGTVYDPKEGKEYSGEFTLSPDGNSMYLRGYVMISMFGRTQTWYRTTHDAPLH